MGSSVAVQKIAYKQVWGASNSSLSGSSRPYDYIKNRLFIVFFKFVFIDILKIVLIGKTSKDLINSMLAFYWFGFLVGRRTDGKSGIWKGVLLPNAVTI